MWILKNCDANLRTSETHATSSLLARIIECLSKDYYTNEMAVNLSLQLSVMESILSLNYSSSFSERVSKLIYRERLVWSSAKRDS